MALQSFESSHEAVGRVDGLPSELLNAISNLISLQDLKNFRLVNKAISVATFGILRSHIGQKAILLTENLAILEDKIKSDEMWRYVTAIRVEEPSEVMVGDIERIADLLVKVFLACKSYDNFNSLTVQTVSRAGFHMVMKALQEVRLTLATLEMFPGVERKYKITPVDAYRELNHLSSLQQCLQTVTSLSMSISAEASKDNEAESQRSEKFAAQNISALCQFLSLMPHIKTLDLRWFMTPYGSKREQHFLDEFAKTKLAMDQLQSCSLRGVYITEQTLLKLLQAPKLRRVTFTQIRLSDGNFIAIIKALASGKFDYFRLDNVYEQQSGFDYRMLHFKIPGRSEFSYTRGPVTQRSIRSAGPSVVERKKHETTAQLDYCYPPGTPIGKAYRLWSDASARIYGSAWSTPDSESETELSSNSDTQI